MQTVGQRLLLESPIIHPDLLTVGPNPESGELDSPSRLQVNHPLNLLLSRPGVPCSRGARSVPTLRSPSRSRDQSTGPTSLLRAGAHTRAAAPVHTACVSEGGAGTETHHARGEQHVLYERDG